MLANNSEAAEAELANILSAGDAKNVMDAMDAAYENSASTSTNATDQAADDPAMLVERLKDLVRTVDRGTCRVVMLLPAFDRQELWAADGYRSCAAWMNAVCGMSPSAANDRCRVAYALEKLPIIRQLFQLGELSWSKVRALVRVATPENERQLAAEALSMSASAIERAVRQFRDTQTLAGIEDEDARAAAQSQARYASVRHDEDGMVRISARLPPLDGAVVLKSMARAEDEVFQQAGVEQLDTPSSATQRRADALTLMAMKHLNAEPMDVRVADRYQVVVHVDAATLHQDRSNPSPDCGCRAGTEGLRCHIDGGPAIAASQARRLVDDCSIVSIVQSDGEPLSIGRKSRVWPSAISRAIVYRDGHCQFPGCDATRHLQLHHLKHWADGGHTSVDNGVALCGFHHRLVHERRYRIEKTARDASGRLPEKTVKVALAAGGELELKTRESRFRVRREDGSLLS